MYDYAKMYNKEASLRQFFISIFEIHLLHYDFPNVMMLMGINGFMPRALNYFSFFATSAPSLYF